jgi:predicted nucleic acid-binding protein
MTLLIDTGPLVALADARDPRRPAVRRLLREEPGDLIVPAPISAEADYLLGARLGRRAQRGFLTDVAQGRYQVICLDSADYSTLLSYDEKYADLNVGLADLSVVVLAERFRTNRILTFDQRHFRALRPLGGGSFMVLPTDAF